MLPLVNLPAVLFVGYPRLQSTIHNSLLEFFKISVVPVGIAKSELSDGPVEFIECSQVAALLLLGYRAIAPLLPEREASSTAMRLPPMKSCMFCPCRLLACPELGKPLRDIYSMAYVTLSGNKSNSAVGLARLNRKGR